MRHWNAINCTKHDFSIVLHSMGIGKHIAGFIFSRNINFLLFRSFFWRKHLQIKPSSCRWCKSCRVFLNEMLEHAYLMSIRLAFRQSNIRLVWFGECLGRKPWLRSAYFREKNLQNYLRFIGGSGWVFLPIFHSVNSSLILKIGYNSSNATGSRVRMSSWTLLYSLFTFITTDSKIT